MINNNGINQKKMLEKFLRFEQKESLGSLIFESVEIWFYIRNLIYEKYIQNKAGIYRPTSSEMKWIKSGKGTDNNELSHIDILFFHHRREKNNEEYRCIYTDEIIKSLLNRYKYKIIEEPINKSDCNIKIDHYPTKKLKDIIFLDETSHINHLKFFWVRNYVKLKLYFSKKARKLRRDINRELEINIDANELNSLISNCITFEKIFTPIYQKLLKRLSPKILVEVMIPSYYRFLINKLAHQNGIKIIELQHGLIGRYDPIFYQYGIDSRVYMPDKILTFGPYWNKRAQIPIAKSNFIDVGFPYYEKKKKSIQNDTPPNNILIISQGYIGKELSQFACRLANELSKHSQFKNYTLLYKLHPFEVNWRDLYPNLLNENIKVIEHNHENIYDLMSKSICQIGVYSTAIFEGLGMGLRTFIVKEYGAIELDDIIKKYSCISYVEDALDIISFLESDNRELLAAEFEYLKKELWKENSLTNIKKVIDDEMNQRGG